MSKASLYLVIITLATSSSAADLDQETIQRRNTMCDATFILSKKIMGNRQEGLDMPSAIRFAEGNRIAELLVMAAYDLPKFDDESAKTKAITNFANENYGNCLQAFEPKQ